jgi:hypothetical protein
VSPAGPVGPAGPAGPVGPVGPLVPLPIVVKFIVLFGIKLILTELSVLVKFISLFVDNVNVSIILLKELFKELLFGVFTKFTFIKPFVVLIIPVH